LNELAYRLIIQKLIKIWAKQNFGAKWRLEQLEQNYF
jgi:hypothetical protein